MEVFLARQPIFNAKKHVVAYEILYREGLKNAYDPTQNDGDIATASVISDVLVHFGIEGLTKGKKAFINFTQNHLMIDMPFLINPELLIVEIIEDVNVDDKFIDKCKHLKEAGYTLALDNFTADGKFSPIMDLVDIIKIDFLKMPHHKRKRISDEYKALGILLLAEKVETYDDFEDALNLGYDYFQGFFFEKPVMCKAKGINVSTHNYLKALKETVSEEPDFAKLTDIIKNDLSLTYKLLRLINSSAFYRHTEITSINQALTLLGINEIRKWITLIMLRDLSSGQPDELIKVSLNRAFFSEYLASYFNLSDRSTEAFLSGLFSMIDTLMEKPLFEILEELPLKEDVKSGLLGMPNQFHDILKLVRAYEKGEWDDIVAISGTCGISFSEVNQKYIETVLAATRLMQDAQLSGE